METTTNKICDEYLCNICNKQYKNKSGLWKHNKKYHTNNISQMSTKCIQERETGIHNVYNKEIHNDKSCKYCNKILSNRQSRWRHEQICKKDNDTEKIIGDLKNKISEIQSQLSDVLKHAKIHPKTLEKINKNLINGNNNSVNNGVVNNIQIVKFGSEDIKQILNEKEIKKILNCKYKAIEESIKHVHFNDNRPEYRNIYITNLRDNIAYIYNGNKFEAVQKHSVISDLIDQHMNNIEVSLEDYKDKLPEKTADILDKLLEKLQDDETKITDENNNKEYKNYKSYKMNEIKLMIYNETGKNTEVIKLKYNNHKKDKEIDV